MGLERTKEQWLAIFRSQTNGMPNAIGDRIIGDLFGYHHSRGKGGYRAQDAVTVGNALIAYVEFLQPENQTLIPPRFEVVIDLCGAEKRMTYALAEEAHAVATDYAQKGERNLMPGLDSVTLYDYESDSEGHIIGNWEKVAN